MTRSHVGGDRGDLDAAPFDVTRSHVGGNGGDLEAAPLDVTRSQVGGDGGDLDAPPFHVFAVKRSLGERGGDSDRMRWRLRFLGESKHSFSSSLCVQLLHAMMILVVSTNL